MIRKIRIIGKTYRHANRYLKIIKVLIKYGFEDIISQSGLESVIDLGRKIAFRKADAIILIFRTHERISNRISFAIVLASMIVGSSLIVLSKIPPMWNDIPVIGLIGFLSAVILGFWLLISILRHGKM